jgi:general secretion pathway protein K
MRRFRRGRPSLRVVPMPGGALSAVFPRGPGRAPRAPSSQRGIALIAVLWTTVLLTVIASGFAYSMRGEALAARNTMSLAQARAAADGAVDRVAFELLRPRTAPDAWLPNGEPHAWNDGDIAITASAVDESARIDLNSAADPLLKGLLQNVGELDPDAAERVLEAILDWRDADDLRRPNGAEAADYRAAGLKYVPSNSRFESVGDLQRVLGVTPALMAKIADSLTTYARQGGINLATASRGVLLAIPGATPEQVDAFINGRREALASKLPIPAFPAAQGFAAGAAPAWRIHAEASTSDGVTFARDAVVRPSSDPQKRMVVLLWQQGATAPAPRNGLPAATDNATQENGTSKP